MGKNGRGRLQLSQFSEWAVDQLTLKNSKKNLMDRYLILALVPLVTSGRGVTNITFPPQTLLRNDFYSTWEENSSPLCTHHPFLPLQFGKLPT